MQTSKKIKPFRLHIDRINGRGDVMREEIKDFCSMSEAQGQMKKFIQNLRDAYDPEDTWIDAQNDILAIIRIKGFHGGVRFRIEDLTSNYLSSKK